MPAWVVEAYETMLDTEDGRIAAERMDDIRAGRADTVSADQAAKDLGL